MRIRGFTLIEILVVLIIISISTGLVLFSIDVTGHQKAREFIRDIAFMMRYLSDEAILTGRPHAMQFDRKLGRIVPLISAGQSWNAIKVIDALDWDESFEVKLFVDGVEIEEIEEIEEAGETEGESRPPLPQILFHSIGMWEPAGELEISIDGIPHIKIIWGINGQTETEYLYQDESY